ncbi:MAG: DUF4342 domain-containing protein [Clostridia bacterium]|nr:DUF4342 domain-containing protein [Clostridia bacterium]MBR6009644.1 DUF4342 domain-containing protein [Clostridia bacterium]
MTRLEMVEKIREKTGVTYDVAREALEKNDWDMLEALISIQKNNGTYTTINTAEETHQTRINHKTTVSGLGDKLRSAVKWVISLINKGERTRIEISYRDEPLTDISATAAVLLLLVAWYVPVGLFLLGLFTGHKFRISASSPTGILINNLSDKASEKAEEIKVQMHEE